MLRPFLVLLLGLATVSSLTTTTLWTKLDQTLELTCPMPDDGEKIQVCSWRFGDEGAFKSSFKKLHGDRISIEENNTDCMIRIERVEEEDQGIWGCKVHYQNKDGDIIETEAERIIYVAKPEKTHELTCPMPDDGEKSSMKVSSMDKLSTKNATEAATNCISENFDGLNFIQGDDHGSQVTGLKQTSGSQMASVGMDDSLKMFDQTTNTYLGGNNATKLKAQPRGLDHKGNLTEKNGVALADWVFGILYVLLSTFLETYEKMSNIPASEFAFSLGLSPSAAAGASKTGELGIAIGSNGDIIVFGSHCLGVKADFSVELDIVLGAWTSIKDIPGQNFALGLGIDTADLLNELGTDESGGNFKIISNADKVLGGTLSLSYGHGYDLPIDNEITYDICDTDVLMRFDGKFFYNRMKKKLTDM